MGDSTKSVEFGDQIYPSNKQLRFQVAPALVHELADRHQSVQRVLSPLRKDKGHGDERALAELRQKHQHLLEKRRQAFKDENERSSRLEKGTKGGVGKERHRQQKWWYLTNGLISRIEKAIARAGLGSAIEAGAHDERVEARQDIGRQHGRQAATTVLEGKDLEDPWKRPQNDEQSIVRDHSSRSLRVSKQGQTKPLVRRIDLTFLRRTRRIDSGVPDDARRTRETELSSRQRTAAKRAWEKFRRDGDDGLEVEKKGGSEEVLGKGTRGKVARKGVAEQLDLRRKEELLKGVWGLVGAGRGKG